jgi:hypothetical protein
MDHLIAGDWAEAPRSEAHAAADLRLRNRAPAACATMAL